MEFYFENHIFIQNNKTQFTEKLKMNIYTIIHQNNDTIFLEDFKNSRKLKICYIIKNEEASLYSYSTNTSSYVLIDKGKSKLDDNNEIIELLHERLKLGKTRYGHGVIVNADTRDYGTADNNWETMMMEEALDGMIYSAAQLIRLKRARQNLKSEVIDSAQ